MATELDTPIIHGQTVTVQKIEDIILHINEGNIEVTILNIMDSGEPLSRNSFNVEFADIPEGTVKQDFRDVVANIRAFARTKGVLGDGTDTDEF